MLGGWLCSTIAAFSTFVLACESLPYGVTFTRPTFEDLPFGLLHFELPKEEALLRRVQNTKCFQGKETCDKDLLEIFNNQPFYYEHELAKMLPEYRNKLSFVTCSDSKGDEWLQCLNSGGPGPSDLQRNVSLPEALFLQSDGRSALLTCLKFCYSRDEIKEQFERMQLSQELLNNCGFFIGVSVAFGCWSLASENSE
jgi:hypothetical protein